MKILLALRALLPGLLFTLLSSRPALACAACYGDTSGSKMGHAASIGIAAMVVIMLGMLGAIGLFMRHLAYRARHPLPDYDELLSEDGGQPKPGVSL